MPEAMLKPVLLAGSLLCVMSVIDTLAYGVRTAGVITRKLAISLTLFNAVALISRMGNMVSAPVLGNFPDKVYQGQYNADEVLVGLRWCLVFVVAGVVLGGLFMPSLIALFARGIAVLEEKGTLPRALLYGLRRSGGFLRCLRPPSWRQLREYSNIEVLPNSFLLYNVFVTCFYSLGVISTVQAASIDHSVASTAILLSGIVNGIATFLLFLVVDPPGAVIIEQCISGKRPVSHAKTLNLALVVTRLLGTLLAIVLLPLMAQYVLVTARWVDKVLTAGADHELGSAKASAAGLEYELRATGTADGALELELRVHNPRDASAEISYSSGLDSRFTVTQAGAVLWDSAAGVRSTQAVRAASLAPRETQRFTALVDRAALSGADPEQPLIVEARHMTLPAVNFSLSIDLNTPPGGAP